MSDVNGALFWADMSTPTVDPAPAEIVPWHPESWTQPASYEPTERVLPARTLRYLPVERRYVPGRAAIREAEQRVGRVAYATRREDMSHPLPVYATPRYRTGAGNVVVTLTVIKGLAATAVMVTGAVATIVIILKLVLAVTS